MKYLTLFISMLFSASLTMAQQPLKLQRPLNPKKNKMCVVNGVKKFEIKTDEDQAVCNDLKKPSRKGSIVPQKPQIGSPNPITAPPTGY